MKPGALLRVKRKDTLASDYSMTYNDWVDVNDQVIFIRVNARGDLIRVLAGVGVGWIWLDRVSVLIP